MSGRPPQVEATGAVLVGGASRRMGTDKARLEVGGCTLVERKVAQLRAVVAEVLVVGEEAEQLRAGSARPVADRGAPRGGPLAGLAGALAAAGFPHVLVTAVDMPFLVPALARRLLALAAETDADAVVARAPRAASDSAEGEPLQPLLAVYARRVLADADRALAAGWRGPTRLLQGLQVHVLDPAELAALDPEGLSFRNINTPAELERLRAEL